jgi:hypothetical protein
MVHRTYAQGVAAQLRHPADALTRAADAER